MRVWAELGKKLSSNYKLYKSELLYVVGPIIPVCYQEKPDDKIKAEGILLTNIRYDDNLSTCRL